MSQTAKPPPVTSAAASEGTPQAARRARLRRIRISVIAGGLAAFALALGVIFTNLDDDTATATAATTADAGRRDRQQCSRRERCRARRIGLRRRLRLRRASGLRLRAEHRWLFGRRLHRYRPNPDDLLTVVIAAAADTSQLAWAVSRAAGVAALLLSSAAVCAGIAQGAGWVRGQASRDLRPLHEALSIATLVAIAVHGLALLADSYIGFSVADIAVPFASGYQPLWTGLGIVAGWSLAVARAHLLRARRARAEAVAARAPHDGALLDRRGRPLAGRRHGRGPRLVPRHYCRAGTARRGDAAQPLGRAPRLAGTPAACRRRPPTCGATWAAPAALSRGPGPGACDESTFRGRPRLVGPPYVRPQ